MPTLFDAAAQCLAVADPAEKVALTHRHAIAFALGELELPADAAPPEAIRMPGRPPLPRLVHPREVPRRGLGSGAGRAAFVHAIAHIELNAIDLAWDAAYRFRGLPAQFYVDWVTVANDESRHFVLLRDRLRGLGYDYGDFDAHNGLWEMAEKTAHDGLARMALVPRVLEARGLDVTPGMIAKLRNLGDSETVQILELILDEEVAHVAAGSHWYRWYCERAGVEPRCTFRELLAKPAIADGHMADLVAQDDLQYGDTFHITNRPQLVHDRRRRIQPTRLQHTRHQRHARQQVMRCTTRHVPQPVVRGKITISENQRGETLAHQTEVIGLLRRYLDPVIVKSPRLRVKTVHAVERQVDRVEFDMRDRVQQRGMTFTMSCLAPRELGRRDELRPRRTARRTQRLVDIGRRHQIQRSSQPVFAQRSCRRTLL